MENLFKKGQLKDIQRPNPFIVEHPHRAVKIEKKKNPEELHNLNGVLKKTLNPHLEHLLSHLVFIYQIASYMQNILFI